MQEFKAAAYRNRRMRFAAVIKSAREEIGTGLWMRVDGPEDGKTLGFDNMLNWPIQGTTDWHTYEVVLDVPQESVYVAFGILLCGRGQAWLRAYPNNPAARKAIKPQANQTIKETLLVRCCPPSVVVTSAVPFQKPVAPGGFPWQIALGVQLHP